MEVDDRIFSTSIDLTYTFAPFPLVSPTDAKVLDFVIPESVASSGLALDEAVYDTAKQTTLEVFAADSSASVQVIYPVDSPGFAYRLSQH